MKFSTKELKYILKQKKIKNYSNMNKAQLLEKMEEIYIQKGGEPKSKGAAAARPLPTGQGYKTNNTSKKTSSSSKNNSVAKVPDAASVKNSLPVVTSSILSSKNSKGSAANSSAMKVSDSAKPQLSFNKELQDILKKMGKKHNITQNQNSSYGPS
jgi:hypothetical protein